LIALLTPLCLRQAVLKPKSGFEKWKNSFVCSDVSTAFSFMYVS
jgi:hypothetical protein